jgi:hypothetical protein
LTRDWDRSLVSFSYSVRTGKRHNNLCISYYNGIDSFERGLVGKDGARRNATGVVRVERKRLLAKG